MGRESQEGGPTKQYASNRSSFPKPQVQPWIHLTWVNVESPHAFRASYKRWQSQSERGRREDQEGEEKKRRRQEWRG